MLTNVEAPDPGFGDAVDDFLADEKAGKPQEQPEKTPAKAAPAKVTRTPAKPADEPAPETEPETDPEADDAKETDEPVKDGPWRAELARRGIDTPEVNQYMAEVVQPYMTRLEQQGGEIAQMFEGDAQAADIAAGILQGLDSDPADTVAKLISMLDIDADAINEALGGYDGGDDEGDVAPDGAPDEDAGQVENRDPWVQQQIEKEQREQDEAAYDAFMKTVAEEFGEGFDENLFNLAIASTGGDVNAAMELYPTLVEKYAPKPETTPAPPVMGAGRPGAGAGPQPAQKTYSGKHGLDDAFNDFFSEERAKRGR